LTVSAPWVPHTRWRSGPAAHEPAFGTGRSTFDPPRSIRLRRCELGSARYLFRSVAYPTCGSGSSSSETELMQ
jgi:hypothetical protein